MSAVSISYTGGGHVTYHMIVVCVYLSSAEGYWRTTDIFLCSKRHTLILPSYSTQYLLCNGWGTSWLHSERSSLLDLEKESKTWLDNHCTDWQTKMTDRQTDNQQRQQTTIVDLYRQTGQPSCWAVRSLSRSYDDPGGNTPSNNAMTCGCGPCSHVTNWTRLPCEDQHYSHERVPQPVRTCQHRTWSWRPSPWLSWWTGGGVVERGHDNGVGEGSHTPAQLYWSVCWTPQQQWSLPVW